MSQCQPFNHFYFILDILVIKNSLKVLMASIFILLRFSFHLSGSGISSFGYKIDTATKSMVLT